MQLIIGAVIGFLVFYFWDTVQPAIIAVLQTIISLVQGI